MSFFRMLARVGIISFLSVFSLSQAQSAEVEMKEEMYSDNKPKYKNIFTIDLSKDYHWDDEGFLKNSERAIIDLRVNQLFRHVSQFFQEIFFDSFLVSFSKKKNRHAILFSRLKLGKLKDFLVVECQYHDRSLSPYFEKEEGHIDSRAKRPKKEKWNIVRTQSEKDNWRFFGSATELSWKWVDFVIHDTALLANRFSEDDPVDGVMRQRLYQKIKRIGLEKAVTRLAIVVNREPYYSFNTIFDTEEEYQKGRKILLELKESLTKKFSVHQETLNQKGLEKTLSIFIPPSYTPENKRPVRKKLAQQNVIHEHEETENILKRRSAPLTD